MDSTKNAVQVPLHHWMNIAAGRVCQVCSLAQADDEFDDTVPCTPRGAPASVRAVDSADAGSRSEHPA